MAVEQCSARAPFVIRWREGFAIDIAQVDDEHEHLFVSVKVLDLKLVERTLVELLDYVVTHFSNEQTLMEKSGYPACDQHVKLHEKFGAQIADFLSSAAPWSQARIQKLRRFLNKWLIDHILMRDLRFGKWYAQRRAAMRSAISEFNYVGSLAHARCSVHPCGDA
jgi:hemerythrin